MTAYVDVPVAWDPPADYPRHDPTPTQQREVVRSLVARAPWADLGWPDLVESLVSLGRGDIPLSRIAEGHVDAVRLMRKVEVAPDPDALYAVWTRGPSSVVARRAGSAWVLDGTIDFTVGAGVIDRALVPVRINEQLDSVLIDIPVVGWPFDDSRWQTRAMELTRTHRVTLSQQRVRPRWDSEPDWNEHPATDYPGGLGPAAVWAGGAARIADLLRSAVPVNRRTSGQLVRLGRIRTEVASAVAISRDASAWLDDLAQDRVRAATALARGGVAGAVRRAIEDARVVAGPIGLTRDIDLIRAIDDLALFVVQHQADADEAWLGGSR